MNPEFDEVLLTAYLDDEVTDAEREFVEEHLRTSESSRKLLEELRSVRNLVMQLHQAQPNRSFQSGPWNASPWNGDSVKVVLNESSRRWSWPYQKLASVAALIAIAICISMLITRPNGMFIGRLENTSTDSGIQLHTQAAPQPTDQPQSPGKPGAIESLSFSNEFEYRPKPGARPTEGGLAESEAAIATSRDNARVSRGSTGVGAGLSAPGGFGASPSGTQAKSPMPKKQAEVIGNIPLGDPAPALTRKVAAAPSSGMPSQETTAIIRPVNPMVQSLIESLFFDLPVNQSDWVALDSLEGSNDKSVATLDSAGRAVGLGRSLNHDSIVSYRFRKAAEKESVADKKEKLFEPQTTEFFMESAVDTRETELLRPLLVEFQIPREDWGDGAKRLRHLGVGVPVELPPVDYLDFHVTQVPQAKDISRLSAQAGAAKESLASKWEFGLVEAHKSKMASDLKKTTSDGNAPPTARGGMAEAPSVFRIRVRAIKQE